MKKVSFVVDDLVGQGVQYATAIVARAFVKRGWSVEMVLTPIHTDMIAAGGQPFVLPDAVTYVYLPNRHGSRNGWAMRKYLRSCKADLIIAETDIFSWCIVWASFGIAKSKLPRLAQVNHGNTDILSGWKLFKSKIKYWYHYRKFSALMFVNAKSTENFKKMYGFLENLRVGTVNNACVDDVFFEKVKLQPTHPWLVKKECPTLVSAGAYEPYKDHMTLLKAMKIVKDAGRKVRVIVFGRGHLTEKYREYIKENVLEDYVSVGGYTNRLPAEIKASDGFVLSSYWESFGIVLAEGLACGVPCVAADAPYGPREILADGKYGRIVPIKDPQAMAAAIIDCADGKIPVAPDESWQRYTIENIERRYFEIMGV